MTILLLLGANRIDLLDFKVLFYPRTHLVIAIHTNINNANVEMYKVFHD